MGEEDMSDDKKPMSKQERVEALAEDSLEFFGDSLEKAFTNFYDAAMAGNDEDLVYSAVSAWQLANSISKFFREVTLAGLKMGSGDKEKAQAIANAMSRHFQANMKRIGEAVAARSGKPAAIVEVHALPAAEEPYANIQDEGTLRDAGKQDPSLN
jgi:hypothetical protein